MICDLRIANEYAYKIDEFNLFSKRWSVCGFAAATRQSGLGKINKTSKIYKIASTHRVNGVGNKSNDTTSKFKDSQDSQDSRGRCLLKANDDGGPLRVLALARRRSDVHGVGVAGSSRLGLRHAQTCGIGYDDYTLSATTFAAVALLGC